MRPVHGGYVGTPRAFHLSHATKFPTSTKLAQKGKDGEWCDVRPFIDGEKKKDWPACPVVRITQSCVGIFSTAPYTMG